jgi:two-component system, cell cycle sensor histidine kinase and response regulator CckA
MLLPDNSAREGLKTDWPFRRAEQSASDWEITCRDGSMRVIEWTDVSRQVPLAGWAHWAVGIDVTPRRRTMDALRASEVRYAQLVDNMENAVAVYEAVDGGRDFVIREFNRAAELIEGVSRETLLGRPIREVFPGVEAFGIFEVLRRVHRTGKAERFPVALYQDERHAGWRDNYIYPLPTGEIVAVYSDETERRQAEIALQESESRLRGMFDAAQDGIFMKDLELRYTHANRALVRISGLPADRVIGHTDAEIFDAPTSAAILAADRRVLDGASIEIERQLEVAGAPRIYQILKAPVRDASGAIIGICGIARDLTAERCAQDQLRYDASLLSSLSDAVVSTDLDFRIRSWNHAAEIIYGRSEGEVLGKDVETMLGVERADGSTREGLLRSLRRTGCVQEEEHHHHREGTRIDVLRSTTLLRGADAKPTGTVSVIRDITELSRAMSDLQKSEARFRAITETSVDITAIFDRRGRFTYVSPAVERITGFAPAELIGRDRMGELGPDSRDPIQALFPDGPAPDGATIAMPPFSVRRRDGGLAYLAGNARVLFDTPGVDGTVASLRDVTAQHRTEIELRRAQKMEAIGLLAGGIAHDFNNILYAILGYAELVRDRVPEGTEAHDGIQQVLRAGQRAAEIVRRLRTFTRETDGERRAVALAPLLDETLELVRGTIPPGVRLTSHCAPCDEVTADPTQLTQLVLNLCTNACEAMQEGPGELDVALDEVVLVAGDPRVGPDLLPGRYARIGVRDTGPGMDEETQARVFEPYFTTKAPRGGTGLGLAMVHSIARNHYGAVRIESEAGKGTTFSVYLPLGLAAVRGEGEGEEMRWRAS